MVRGQAAGVMDIDALAGALGVETIPDAAAAAAAAPPTQLAPLGAFDSQPVVPPPTAGSSSSLPAVHGLAAPVAPSASGSAAPASGGGLSFKDLVVGLQNDPSLSDAVKAQILVMGDEYQSEEKKTFFSKLKDLVGKARIQRVLPMLLQRSAPSAGRAPKRGAPDTQQEMGPPPNKRMRADVTDGYADASAEAEAASAGGAGAKEGGEDMRAQFDVLHQSGVDLAVEDAAMSVADAVAEARRTEAAAASEAHRPFVTGTELQSRLAELAGQLDPSPSPSPSCSLALTTEY